MKPSLLLRPLLLAAAVACAGCTAAPSPFDETDPRIGTGGHGHVFLGVSVPHGMVQLGPNNITQGWDWCSGYHDSDSTLVGFAHTHLSGTGISDLGDILFLPVTGAPGSLDLHSNRGFVTTFRKENQTARPDYYRVRLDRYGIEAELTAALRTGLHRYTYPSGEQPSVIIDLQAGAKSLLFRPGAVRTGLTLHDGTTVTGYRTSSEWAVNHTVYFAARFSRPVTGLEACGDSTARPYDAAPAFPLTLQATDLIARLFFGPAAAGQDPDRLLADVSVSYVSEANALKNLEAGRTGFDFERIRRECRRNWEESLSAVTVETPDPEVRKIFYTALYHTQLAPFLFSDADGSYLGADGRVYRDTLAPRYTVFSLWDTYRALHPLYTLIPEDVAGYVNSLLDIHERQGRLPMWHLAGQETNCMVGIGSVPVIADAVLKDIPGIDPQRAWRAVRTLDSTRIHGLHYLLENEWIPAESQSETVAKGLEFAIDDDAAARLARRVGDTAKARLHARRARYYASYFDPQTRFMRGRMADGSWRTPFDPSHSLHLQDDYTEGNAWQYTWLVPHDVPGLIALFGGEEAFAAKLDSLFLQPSELNEGASADITGMIGQYAHGNEPSHHILYLYAYAGQPWKTAEKVRQVFREFYRAAPDGLIGNEDCGQMSAWYIFSALGFYPVHPTEGTYIIGSPLVDRAVIRLQGGGTFTVEARGNSPEHPYVQRIILNGRPLQRSWFRHSEVRDGGSLIFEMGAEPSPEFGVRPQDRPQSFLQ